MRTQDQEPRTQEPEVGPENEDPGQRTQDLGSWIKNVKIHNLKCRNWDSWTDFD